LRSVSTYGPTYAYLNTMLTNPERFTREPGNPLAQHASQGAEIIAHMKVISPLTSTGPSIRARVVSESEGRLVIRFPHVVFAGALVQVRIQNKIFFGQARRCITSGPDYEIEIEKQEVY